MTIDMNFVGWIRYYNTPPNQKTPEQCRSHGADHKAYQWSPQIDPRWSEDQKMAYAGGYNGNETGSISSIQIDPQEER